jgi:hypothetical protein
VLQDLMRSILKHHKGKPVTFTEICATRSIGASGCSVRLTGDAIFRLSIANRIGRKAGLSRFGAVLSYCRNFPLPLWSAGHSSVALTMLRCSC